ncbi:class II fumarate hydratase [Natronospira bacteriovora]|uniref:Fumarate hydratase class II n=1 Tax=Natronospira bacteriovora TaxID=3069753 RepID=A0ABU0W9R4_9GAMM|nr:class II fumarate hydratase [Natronospira sp. AB-CW4]MDQ2070779.1 class II fumarate hydratase [Natronospira sp. AB-CW4]
MSDKGFRIEKDSMGELKVPEEALWGAQTQRAVQNFPISGLHMPRAFIRALGLIKWSAAAANRELGLLDDARADAIQFAAEQVAEGRHDAHFPVDVFQTGSGTSSNMNANEVIARLATDKLGEKVHPNDDVNMGQSSNDVIPTAIHVSAALEVNERLLPALRHLAGTTERRAGELAGIAKTGRTHLMDAMPVRFDQTMGAWATQIRRGCQRVEATLPRLYGLAQGGTAVGTGINAHEDFADSFARHLSERSGLEFFSADDKFEVIATQDTAVELSGQLKTVAVSLMKIANDLRWMNSGPLAGLSEITLPALQPGSSIMPGKINPVIPEAVCMLSAQVMGNDTTITVGGQSGNFELNVMLPVIGYNLLQSIELLANGSTQLADSAIAGFKVNEDNLKDALEKNPILVTAMNPVIGYEKGAAVAKKAYAEGRPIRDVARDETDLPESELERLLDAVELTKGGIKG